MLVVEQCGVVLSVRPHKDALQIWNRDTEGMACLEDSLRELREVMGIDDSTINYQAHRVRPVENTFDRAGQFIFLYSFYRDRWIITRTCWDGRARHVTQSEELPMVIEA